MVQGLEDELSRFRSECQQINLEFIGVQRMVSDLTHQNEDYQQRLNTRVHNEPSTLATTPVDFPTSPSYPKIAVRLVLKKDPKKRQAGVRSVAFFQHVQEMEHT